VGYLQNYFQRRNKLFSFRSVEKFLKDHPEYSSRKKEILERAKKLADTRLTFHNFEVQMIFGDKETASHFWEVASRNSEHLKLWCEDYDADARFLLAKRTKGQNWRFRPMKSWWNPEWFKWRKKPKKRKKWLDNFLPKPQPKPA